jgi:hypothetical protein
MASPMSEPASKRKHKLTAEQLNMLSALLPTIDVHKNKCTDENDFERIARAVRCTSQTVRRYHKKMQDAESGRMSENLAATASCSLQPMMTQSDALARKRKHELLLALVPTIGTHTKTNDYQRIASLAQCSLSTVRNFHTKFQAEMTASAASSALVAAGSSAPARAWVGGSGGAGAAPCGWSAPPAQVILTIVAAHPRLSRHTRSPLLAAPLPGGNGDFEKITPVAGSRPPGGRSAPPH